MVLGLVVAVPPVAYQEFSLSGFLSTTILHIAFGSVITYLDCPLTQAVIVATVIVVAVLEMIFLH
mgnify:CR=1 FL=1